MVTAAVVSWNTRALLARCLESLAPEVERGRLEVWVVDNASQDGSADLVRERFGWARLVATGENLGFGPAVNRVAAETSTPWLVVANADVALTPGALAALLAAATADPGAGALAPRLVRADGTTDESVFPFPTLSWAVGWNLRRRRTWWEPERGGRVPWAIAAFLLVRREAWDAAGGFDPGQWMYAEDLDLGWRLRAAGWATRYVPEARVLHAGAAATGQAWGQARTDRWSEATYTWVRRRRGRAEATAVAVLNALGAAARGQRWWARTHLRTARAALR